jgi:hypothetical protein
MNVVAEPEKLPALRADEDIACGDIGEFFAADDAQAIVERAHCQGRCHPSLGAGFVGGLTPVPLVADDLSRRPPDRSSTTPMVETAWLSASQDGLTSTAVMMLALPPSTAM